MCHVYFDMCVRHVFCVHSYIHPYTDDEICAKSFRQGERSSGSRLRVPPHVPWSFSKQLSHIAYDWPGEIFGVALTLSTYIDTMFFL